MATRGAIGLPRHRLSVVESAFGGPAARDQQGAAMSDTIKYLLDESRIPTSWYNLMADLPSPPPPVLHPGTLEPIGFAGEVEPGPYTANVVYGNVSYSF